MEAVKRILSLPLDLAQGYDKRVQLIRYLEKAQNKIPAIYELEPLDWIHRKVEALKNNYIFGSLDAAVEELYQKTMGAIGRQEKEISKKAVPKILRGLDRLLSEEPYDLLPKPLKPVFNTVCKNLDLDCGVRDLFWSCASFPECWSRGLFPLECYSKKGREKLDALIGEYLHNIQSRIYQLKKQRRLLGIYFYNAKEQRRAQERIDAVIAIYEKHLFSWQARQ